MKGLSMNVKAWFSLLALTSLCCANDSNTTVKKMDIKENVLFQGKNAYDEHLKQRSKSKESTKIKEKSAPQTEENPSFMMHPTVKE